MPYEDIMQIVQRYNTLVRLYRDSKHLSLARERRQELASSISDLAVTIQEYSEDHPDLNLLTHLEKVA